jgi:signal transduction histidine kinase
MFSSGLIIILMAGAMYYIYDFERRESIDEDLQDYANFLTTGLTTEAGDLSEVYDKLFEKKNIQSLKQRWHRYALVSNDSIIFEAGLNVNLDSAISTMETEGEYFWKTTFNTIASSSGKYRTYSVPLASKIKKEYRLIVFSSLERFYESLYQLKFTILMIVPIALIFAAIIGFFIAKKLFSSIRLITETASNISYNNLSARVPTVNNKDELSQLAETFNSMIERLEKTVLVEKRFIADASHDLRTPLTVIQIELELLLQNPDTNPEFKQGIEKCLKETEMMTKLAEDLLLLARFDSNQLILNKENVRIDELLIDCVSQLNNLAKANQVSFVIDVDDSATIESDLKLMRRLIINIIDNAIKYSYPNEKIVISLKTNNQECLISVNNKGVPIKNEFIGVIFNRFQRADESRTSSGFGLGLSIAKAIVDIHFGELVVTSNEESGTTIKIRLKTI